MPRYVFYDTEGTGTDVRFDVPLQFAAIATDAEFNETDSYDIRCRLPEYIVPHPMALYVTHTDPNTLRQHDLSEFEFARRVNAIQTATPNTIFVGQNILSYDEEILRSQMWRNFQDPYISSKKGNMRIDTLPMLQFIYALNPGFIKTNRNENGNTVFKLDQIAPLNGFQDHHAHDALGDARATIFIYNEMKKRCPEAFAIAESLADKENIKSMIRNAQRDGTPLYMMTHFGKPEWHCVFPLGEYQNKYACLDLSRDVTPWVDANQQEWFERAYPYLAQKQTNLPGFESVTPDNEALSASWQLKTITANKQPTLVSEAMLKKAGYTLNDLHMAYHPTPEKIQERINAINTPIAMLKSRIAMEQKAKSYDNSHNEVEENIYNGFPSYADKRIISSFNDMNYTWEERRTLGNSFESDDLKRLATRLVFAEKPSAFPETLQNKIRKNFLEKRVYAQPKNNEDLKWCTMPAALRAAEEMHADPTKNKDQTSVLLDWYRKEDQRYRDQYNAICQNDHLSTVKTENQHER